MILNRFVAGLLSLSLFVTAAPSNCIAETQDSISAPEVLSVEGVPSDKPVRLYLLTEDEETITSLVRAPIFAKIPNVPVLKHLKRLERIETYAFWYPWIVWAVWYLNLKPLLAVSDSLALAGMVLAFYAVKLQAITLGKTWGRLELEAWARRNWLFNKSLDPIHNLPGVRRIITVRGTVLFRDGILIVDRMEQNTMYLVEMDAETPPPADFAMDVQKVDGEKKRTVKARLIEIPNPKDFKVHFRMIGPGSEHLPVWTVTAQELETGKKVPSHINKEWWSYAKDRLDEVSINRVIDTGTDEIDMGPFMAGQVGVLEFLGRGDWNKFFFSLQHWFFSKHISTLEEMAARPDIQAHPEIYEHVMRDKSKAEARLNWTERWSSRFADVLSQKVKSKSQNVRPEIDACRQQLLEAMSATMVR